MNKFPGNVTEWFGFSKYDFSSSGMDFCIATPKKQACGNPWIWRAEFFGHEPQVDLALLERGWHVVYVPTAAGLYGSPDAVNIWNRAYDYLTQKQTLAKKPVLEGFSRGGLLVYNWAAANPDKVACIYADAPVCVIQSWPGGMGKSARDAENWQYCLQAYALSEEQAINFKHNPIDKLKPLADSNVPLLHVCGDIDDVVPMQENTNIIKQRYTELGGHMELVIKPNCGHHPHSLRNPEQIVDFIIDTVKNCY